MGLENKLATFTIWSEDLRASDGPNAVVARVRDVSAQQHTAVGTTNFRETLGGSFSAVSTPILTVNDALESSRRDLHNEILSLFVFHELPEMVQNTQVHHLVRPQLRT